jgi:hypothetical protein
MEHPNADCKRAVIKLYVGNIAQDVMEITPQAEHDQAENEFLAHKQMTVEEANQVDRVWRDKALDDWNQGVREKHLTRAESKRVAESKMFPQFIKGAINPYWETFQHCEFEAQGGLMEMGLQLQRSKIRTLKNCTDPMFGPKVAAGEAELQRKRVLAAPENWRPITITSCIYWIFTSMVSEFIQHRLHNEGKRKIFSLAQKGFVSGIQGCMEHAVLTRELIAHAQRNQKNLCIVQIDFSNAFGSVPQGLIRYNMEGMSVPDNIIACVMDIYNGWETVINVQTGESKPIQWTSGTVQGCPLSPALFNICLEPLLRELDTPKYKRLGFGVVVEDGEEIKLNTAAYADDLILYAERRDGIDQMLALLSRYCRYAGMIVNVKKCVALAEIWQNGKRSELDEPFEYYPRWESELNKGEGMEIPTESASLYLGTTIAFNREDEAKHGKHVLTSMQERDRIRRRLKRDRSQNSHG